MSEAQKLTGLQRRKKFEGVVVSDKMDKTVVVKVVKRVRHPVYQKYVSKSRKFMAHNENNQAKMGDLVSIVESRPLSRLKRWAVAEIVRKAGAAATLEVNA